MSLAELFLLDFDAELAKTRSYFAVLPEDKASWRPHALSPTLGQLAKHIAMVPGLGIVMMTTESMDVGSGPPPLAAFVDRADLMRTLEENNATLRGLLAKASDEFLMANWAFKAGDTVLDGGPRAAMYRVMIVHHIVHHRAQLGVYLRMLGVPLPGLYGPTADGAWQPNWPGSK
jgi:uncharacterized damage-inducible protein DinB